MRWSPSTVSDSSAAMRSQVAVLTWVAPPETPSSHRFTWQSPPSTSAAMTAWRRSRDQCDRGRPGSRCRPARTRNGPAGLGAPCCCRRCTALIWSRPPPLTHRPSPGSGGVDSLGPGSGRAVAVVVPAKAATTSGSLGISSARRRQCAMAREWCPPRSRARAVARRSCGSLGFSARAFSSSYADRYTKPCAPSAWAALRQFTGAGASSADSGAPKTNAAKKAQTKALFFMRS